MEGLNRDHRYETGYVYFIQAGDRPIVKIGATIAPLLERLASLQTASHDRLRLIGAIDLRAKGVLAAHRAEYSALARQREREIHTLFARDRVQGEWFALSERLQLFIASEANVRLGAG
jgi:hypothetical protein